MSLAVFHNSAKGGLFGVSLISLYCPLATMSGEGMLKFLCFDRTHLSCSSFSVLGSNILSSAVMSLVFIDSANSLNSFLNFSSAFFIEVRILISFTLSGFTESRRYSRPTFEKYLSIQ